MIDPSKATSIPLHLIPTHRSDRSDSSMATVAEDIAGGADLGPKKVVPIVDEPASDAEHESAPWATGDFGNKLATPEKAEGEARAQHLEAAPASVSVVSDDEGAAATPKPQIRGVKTFGDKYLPFAAGEKGFGGRASWMGGRVMGARRGHAPAVGVDELEELSH